jgi:hypothetical protein
MSAASDSIQKLLQTLAKHSDVVSQAFAGPVAGGDKPRDAAINALEAIGALKPYEEETYYLGAPLYDYFASVLSSFHAMRALTRIRGYVVQASNQWDELRQLRDKEVARDRMERALERSIIEIGDIVDRNIALLGSMVIDRYGDVSDLASKLRQNNFYEREVRVILVELGQVGAFVRKVEESAVAEGHMRIRQLVTRRLGSHLLSWAARLKDAQSIISRRLIEVRTMGRRLKMLARYAGWLRSNPTENGWEINVGEDAVGHSVAVDAGLCRPEPFDMRVQPDFADVTASNAAKLVDLATKLKVAAETRPARPTQVDDDKVIADENSSFTATLKPHQLALRQFCADVAGAPEGVSLAKWKRCQHVAHPALAEMPDEVWLFYAASQLDRKQYRLRVIDVGAVEAFMINSGFSDIEVSRVIAKRKPGMPSGVQTQRAA